jgi:hypothetical protein
MLNFENIFQIPDASVYDNPILAKKEAVMYIDREM